MLSLRGGRRLAKGWAKNGKLGVMGEGGFRAPGLIPARARGWKRQQPSLRKARQAGARGLRVASRGGRRPPGRGRVAGRTREAAPVERLFGVRELAVAAARDPSELTPQTCSWSLRSRPSSWGQRVRPGQGAAACGVQRQGPGQAPEFREREAAAARRGSPARRGGETARVPRGASTTSRGVRGRDDCQSLARSSPKPQLQPKTKTLPTCQQRRSSLGRAARASERRGRGGALRGGGASRPLPHSAQPRTVSPGAPRTWGDRVRAHRDKERQGSAHVRARACVCV